MDFLSVVVACEGKRRHTGSFQFSVLARASHAFHGAQNSALSDNYCRKRSCRDMDWNGIVSVIEDGKLWQKLEPCVSQTVLL